MAGGRAGGTPHLRHRGGRARLALALAFVGLLAVQAVPSLALIPTTSKPHLGEPPTVCSPDSLQALLRAAGILPEQVIIDPVAVRLDRVRMTAPLALNEILLAEPLRAPLLLRGLAGDLRVDDGYYLLRQAALWQDHPLDPQPSGAYGPQLPEDDPDPRSGRQRLFDTVAGFYDDGKRLDGNRRDELRRRVARVPDLDAGVAADLIDAGRRAAAELQHALRGAPLPKSRLGADGLARAVMAGVDSLAVDVSPGWLRSMQRIAEGVDFERMNASAEALLSATYDVPSRRRMSGEPFEFRWDSPLGQIALSRGSDDTYRGDYFLILDQDGDDVYEGGGRVRGPANPVSLLMDLAGNDRYVAADSSSPGPAGAIGGCAILIDREGDDSYQAWTLGLGAAAFGVARLEDNGGTDRFEAWSFAQGAGMHGIGVLNSKEGNDNYRLGAMGQGFGGPGGVGWLFTGSGNDSVHSSIWALNGSGRGLLDRWQRAFSQGCGLGFARPGVAGGFGGLFDSGGDDSYAASDMSQGCGIARGIGLFLDSEGRDDKTLGWRGQGYGEGLGVGVALDLAGDDRIHSSCHYGVGSAVSSGLGVFQDDAGDDRYAVGEFSCGGGTSGVAVFIDASGTDRFDFSGSARGDTGYGFGSVRPDRGGSDFYAFQRGGALFFDLGGLDHYDVAPNRPDGPRNGASWRGSITTDPLNPARIPRRISLGIDRE